MSAEQRNGVKSDRLAQITGLTILDRVVHLIKQAGQPAEADTKRDGFLSYKSESHSLGAGLGIGFAIGASGELSILGGILTFVIYGNRDGIILSAELIRDIRAEVPYFLGGLFFGLVLGIVARLALGYGMPLSWMLRP